jgi:hypothetical protein
MTEYGAVILLVAAVAGVVLVGGVPDRVSALIGDAVCAVPGYADCAEPEDPGIGVDPDTEAASTQTEGLRPAGAAATEDVDEDDTGDGWVLRCDPLCPPTSVPPTDLGAEMPPEPYPEVERRVRSSLDSGESDLGDVSGCNMWTLCLEHEIEDAHEDVGEWVDDSGPLLPDAAAALRHYLRGDGGTMTVDVEQLLEDVPEFREAVTAQQHELGQQAIAEAKKIPPNRFDGPITFPVSGNWTPFGLNEDGTEFGYADANWQQTMGDWHYYLHGHVVAHPPEDSGGEWTYTVTTGTSVRTLYSFQEGGDTDLQWRGSPNGPLGVGDEVSREELYDMHRTGLAEDFSLVGTAESSTATPVTGP